jgi:ABC-type transport system substrate-binding protein
MTTSRSRAVLGVILGLALAATAVWLALLLTRGDQPSRATQPSTAAATTSPTPTTTAPAFTKDGAVAGLRIIVRKRQDALNTLDASILETIYTTDCRLANGTFCLAADRDFLAELKRKDQHLQGYPNVIKEIKVLSWEPQGRTAIMRLSMRHFLPRL